MMTGIPASVTAEIGSPSASAMVGEITIASGLDAGGALEDRDLAGGVILRRAELVDLDPELLAGGLRRP